jgi:uncharacterized protein YyaL (SSP411 family)
VPKEIAIIGPREVAATQSLLDTVFQRYLPNKVVVGASGAPLDQPVLSEAEGVSLNGAESPLLEGREMVDGKPTAHVCQHYVCQLPVTEPEALAKQLEG